MANLGFNINSFIKDSPEEKIYEVDSIPPEEKKTTKAKRRRKSEPSESLVPATPPASPVVESSMSYIQQNIPYASAYENTNAQLDESIAQLNILGGELVAELQTIKASKTLRNKYTLINDMTATAINIINSKVAAIREKNKTTNDVMHLELARLKELKTQANEKDDNARMADMYDAFINTPVGVGRVQLGPAVQDMVLPTQQYEHISIGNDQAIWEQGLDPAQNRMILEAKGVIDTVVMYDENTGNRWFEVIDKSTGQPVPNVEKPDNSYIYDLDINIRGGFAKDSNRNTIYPLIVVNGGDTSMTQY